MQSRRLLKRATTTQRKHSDTESESIMNKLVVMGVSLVTFLIYLVILCVPSFSYDRMIRAYFIVAALGVLGMFIARYAVTVTKTVKLKGVGAGFAFRSAHQALWSAEDHLLGWPSGTFEFPDELNSTEGKLVAREWAAKGSGNIVLGFIRIPWRIVLTISTFFLAFNWIGAILAFVFGLFMLIWFAFFFLVPLVIAWLVEIALKPFLRSEIVAIAEQIDSDTAQLTFQFRGASALIIQKRVMSAFDAPKLPAKYAGLTASTSEA